MEELQDAQLIKHLPKSCLLLLLNIFKLNLISGDFPSDWKAIIIPTSKPGKVNTNLTYYRTIALKRCTCKTTKRIINCRLVCYLESLNLLTCSVVHLVRFKSFLQ